MVPATRVIDVDADVIAAAAVDRSGAGDCLRRRWWALLDAPLTVQLECEYLDERTTGSPLDACPELSPTVEESNEAQFGSLILPGIERAVNEAPKYADFRRVHLSRVAEWYRRRSQWQATAYSDKDRSCARRADTLGIVFCPPRARTVIDRMPVDHRW